MMDPRLIQLHATAVDQLPAKEAIEYIESLTEEIRNAVLGKVAYHIVFLSDDDAEEEVALVVPTMQKDERRKVEKMQFFPPSQLEDRSRRPKFIGTEGCELMVHFANEEKSVAKFIDGAWQDAAGRRWHLISEVAYRTST